MTVTFDFVCYALAAICFFVAIAWQAYLPRINLVALGLFLFMLTFLVS